MQLLNDYLMYLAVAELCRRKLMRGLIYIITARFRHYCISWLGRRRRQEEGWQRICHTINPCRSIGSRSLVRRYSNIEYSVQAIAMKKQGESRGDDGEEEESQAGRAERKIEIKGRWVIAVAWEAVGDKSNHSSNRNATPGSDHERKNSMANPPGLIVPRVQEPMVLIGPILSCSARIPSSFLTPTVSPYSSYSLLFCGRRTKERTHCAFFLMSILPAQFYIDRYSNIAE